MDWGQGSFLLMLLYSCVFFGIDTKYSSLIFVVAW